MQTYQTETKETLVKIKSLIVEKDPNDDDKFLRQLWDLASEAIESLQAREEWLRGEIREKMGSMEDVKLSGAPTPKRAYSAGYDEAMCDVLSLINDQKK